MKKIFTKEVQIALAAIVAAVFLVFGINFLKGINLFQASNLYHVTFKNINGLAEANPVFANGYPVGTVRSITFPYNGVGDVVVAVELNENMRVPQGTKALLESSMLGETKMNLVLGTNPLQFLAPGDTIHGAPANGALEQLSDMMPVIQSIMPKLDSILANLNRLTADPALTQTIHNTADITHNLKETTQRVNGLLAKDVPALSQKLHGIGNNVEQLTNNLTALDLKTTVEQTNATLIQMNAATTKLNMSLQSKDNSLGLLLNDRTLYDNLSNTMGSADSLLIDLRKNPKRYVHFSIFGRKNK